MNFECGILNYLVWLILLVGCNVKDVAHEHQDTYTCPMHPTVIQDKPGACPICGMDLLLKGKPGEEMKITAELNYLLKPTNAMVISSIKTVMPVQKSIDVAVNATGLITYDTRRFTSVPIRFGGRIEKLFIKYNFQPIRKGQKILEIYSPELVTAQRDLLYLLTSDKENTKLIEGAKEKLRLLGLSDSQITLLASSMLESYSFTVYSPVDGYVVEEGALAGSELLTREGMYVNTGQAIFKVVNTESVWAEFDVPQQNAASIKVNDPLQIALDNAVQTVNANVDFIQPFFKNGENFIKVRVYLPNAGHTFQIGQLVTASFSRPSGDSMWIPLTARLDLGTKEIAFIKRRGIFRPAEIITSRQSGDWIEVLSGLEASDSLAYNAQFMVDSESFIKIRN